MRLVLRPLKAAPSEYAAVTEEPIPNSLTSYFEVRSFAFANRPTVDDLPVSIRLVTVGKEIKSRLTLMSDLIRRLEALEWEVRLVEDEVVISNDLSVEEGWRKLRQQGVSDQLLPMLQPGSDLPPRALAARRSRVRQDPPPAP
ncbi:MAG TPA: hypothetical protein VI138_06315 [Candidatus Dormibacteraeota bacterium]